jgi:hypothetical protein
MMPISPDAAARHVERLVIGADYGADGYTTVDQADQLARLLELRPGVRLLELGSGSGWPGLHLATTGCAIVLTDAPGHGVPPPGVGLQRAARRASTEGLIPCLLDAGKESHVCPRRARTTVAS